MSGWTGVDFSRLDQQIRHVQNDAGRTALENITRADPDRTWTVRQVAEHVWIGGIGPIVVGSPQTVADELEAGSTRPTSTDSTWPSRCGRRFRDIADMVVPELSGAVATRGPTRPARCVKSCSDQDTPVWRRPIRRRSIGRM